MSLISQVANIVSMLIYGVFIIIGLAVLVIVGFAIYKFVMWTLFASSSKEKKESSPHPMETVIKKEIEFGKDLKEIKEVLQ